MQVAVNSRCRAVDIGPGQTGCRRQPHVTSSAQLALLSKCVGNIREKFYFRNLLLKVATSKRFKSAVPPLEIGMFKCIFIIIVSS